jgi:uncharacterized membrane protein
LWVVLVLLVLGAVRIGEIGVRFAVAYPLATLTAVVLFALAAWRQHPGYQHGDVTTGGLVLTVAGFVVLTVGGWLGGSVVFVHGTRVLEKKGEPQAWNGQR